MYVPVNENLLDEPRVFLGEINRRFDETERFADARNIMLTIPGENVPGGRAVRLSVQEVLAPLYGGGAFLQGNDIINTETLAHGGLLGLSGDDHPQYGAIADAEAISGLWTFDRGAAAPFAVGASSTMVAYLDADKIDGYEGSELGVRAEAESIGGVWTFEDALKIDSDGNYSWIIFEDGDVAKWTIGTESGITGWILKGGAVQFITASLGGDMIFKAGSGDNVRIDSTAFIFNEGGADVDPLGFRLAAALSLVLGKAPRDQFSSCAHGAILLPRCMRGAYGCNSSEDGATHPAKLASALWSLLRLTWRDQWRILGES